MEIVDYKKEQRELAAAAAEGAGGSGAGANRKRLREEKRAKKREKKKLKRAKKEKKKEKKRLKQQAKESQNVRPSEVPTDRRELRAGGVDRRDHFPERRVGGPIEETRAHGSPGREQLRRGALDRGTESGYRGGAGHRGRDYHAVGVNGHADRTWGRHRKEEARQDAGWGRGEAGDRMKLPPPRPRSRSPIASRDGAIRRKQEGRGTRDSRDRHRRQDGSPRKLEDSREARGRGSRDGGGGTAGGRRVTRSRSPSSSSSRSSTSSSSSSGSARSDNRGGRHASRSPDGVRREHRSAAAGRGDPREASRARGVRNSNRYTRSRSRSPGRRNGNGSSRDSSRSHGDDRRDGRRGDERNRRR